MFMRILKGVIRNKLLYLAVKQIDIYSGRLGNCSVEREGR